MVDTLGQHEESRHLYNEARNLYIRTPLSTRLDMRRILLNIAMTYHCEGQFDKSIETNLKAKDGSGMDNLVEALLVFNIGEIYRQQGLYTLAMKYSEQRLDMRK